MRRLILVLCLVPLLAFAQTLGNPRYESVTIGAVATATCKVLAGSADPEGSVTANACSIYLRTNGSVYKKGSGSGNTGWSAVVAGGGGGLTLLDQQTASSSASLAFTTGLTSTYDDYLIEFVNVLPATNAVSALLRMSTNGGSSYDSTGAYDFALFRWSSVGTGNAGGAGGTAVDLTVGATLANTANIGGLTGFVRLFDPASSTQYKRVVGETSYYTGGAYVGGGVSGVYANTTAVNAFQVLMSSGNITSGTVRLYGIQK